MERLVEPSPIDSLLTLTETKLLGPIKYPAYSRDFKESCTSQVLAREVQHLGPEQ